MFCISTVPLCNNKMFQFYTPTLKAYELKINVKTCQFQQLLKFLNILTNI